MSTPVASQSLFGSLEFGIWILPFDWAQGGELVEPFDICYLMLGISYIQRLNIYLVILFDFFNIFVGHDTRIGPGPSNSVFYGLCLYPALCCCRAT
jgi:hypothetical protein